MDNLPQTKHESENSNPARFESDTQKLVHRHLQDKNHVITEEELRNVRIGVMPPDQTNGRGEINFRGDNAEPAGNASTSREIGEP